MLTLHYHPLSPYSRKALIGLYEKGLDFEPRFTNLFDPAVREQYRTHVNPLCKIPFLEHDDHVVPESSIILEYIDGKFPTDPSLIPEGVDRSRQARFYDRLGDLYLIDRSSTIFFAGMVPEPARDQAAIDKALAGARVALGLFDKELRGKTFLLDERFTMADIAPAVGALALAHQGIDLADYPNVATWAARIAARPSLQRVGAEVGAALAAMASAGNVSEG